MKFDFLELFNAVAAAQKAVTKDYIVAESLDVPITEDATSLDSLDVTLTFFVLGEAFGVPEVRKWTLYGPHLLLAQWARLLKSIRL